MENNKNYEDDLMKEFGQMESTQTVQQNDTKDLLGNVSKQNNVYANDKVEHEVVTDLGRVKNPGMKPGGLTREELDNDPEIQKMNELVNYVHLPMSEFPSRGKFYADELSVHIRAARVGEIREYSMMDETDPNDIIDKMNFMLSSCCRVMYGNMMGSYKDLLDHDRFYLIKRIQELTFKNGETVINLPVPDGACKTKGCKPQKEVKLLASMLERPNPDPQLEKYYDPVNKCYSIATKHYGTIQIAPPTIGVFSTVREWAKSRTQNQKSWDQSIVQLIPFIQREWRNFGDKEIFNLATEFETWDITKFSLIYRFVEKLNATVGMSPTIHVTCESCGGDLEIPIMFQDISDDGTEVRGGFKSLFIPNVSDRLDELL